MFRKLRQRRLKRLEDELISMVANRIRVWCAMFMLDDDSPAQQEGRDIIKELLKEEKKINTKINKIKARM